MAGSLGRRELARCLRADAPPVSAAVPAGGSGGAPGPPGRLPPAAHRGAGGGHRRHQAGRPLSVRPEDPGSPPAPGLRRGRPARLGTPRAGPAGLTSGQAGPALRCGRPQRPVADRHHGGGPLPAHRGPLPHPRARRPQPLHPRGGLLPAEVPDQPLHGHVPGLHPVGAPPGPALRPGEPLQTHRSDGRGRLPVPRPAAGDPARVRPAGSDEGGDRGCSGSSSGTSSWSTSSGPLLPR